MLVAVVNHRERERNENKRKLEFFSSVRFSVEINDLFEMIERFNLLEKERTRRGKETTRRDFLARKIFD